MTDSNQTARWQGLVNTLALFIVGGATGMGAMAFWSGQFGSTQVKATASQGEDNFAIATGLVDQGIEAFYFLDYLTGDLRAAVISRRTGKFTAFYEYNIQADFGTQAQSPKYLMVTGLADLPGGRGNARLGSSLIYIAEATSGQVFAYALPFNSSMNAKGAPQKGQFVLVDGGPFRTAFVRGEE
ncbi:MAG: hypothetical protein RH917_19935 [Lacipirellulaceae bacterium]